MERTSNRVEDLRELQELLDRIVRRMTHRLFTTPRLTQLDVGHAITVIQRVDYPRASIIRKVLPDLIRELGNRRPSFYRYVLVLEQGVHDLEEEIAAAE